MPSFKIINDLSEINLSSDWVPSTKFNSKDRVVDVEGRAVSSSYLGHQYRIVEKREWIFSTPERIERGFLGVIAVICTLGLALFSKSVRDLFTKSKINIRFGIRYYPSEKENNDQSKKSSPSCKRIKEYSLESFSNPFIDRLVGEKEKTKIENIIRTKPPKPKEDDIYIDIDKEASRFFFKDDEQHVVKKIEELMDQNLHQYMTDMCLYLDNEAGLKAKGFTILSNRILEHPELDNWIMKGGAKIRFSFIANDKGSSRSNCYDNIMRVFMAERMSKAIQEEELDILIPEKRLLPSYRTLVKGLHEKYYVFSKKIEILKEDETIEALRQLSKDQQTKVARDICQLIKKTGFMDAHFGNIRWQPTLKKIAIIDTESQGLLVERNDVSPENVNTIKECALIGLQELADRIRNKLPVFAEEAEKAMREVEVFEEPISYSLYA